MVPGFLVWPQGVWFVRCGASRRCLTGVTMTWRDRIWHREHLR